VMRWELKSDSKSENWNKLAALTEAALQTLPADRELLRRLCGALIAAGTERASEVESILAAAVARIPNDAELRIRLARARIGLDRLDEANSQVDEALRLEPQSRGARILKFNLLARTGRWDAARELMDDIAALDPMNGFLCDARLCSTASRSECEAQLAACERELARNPILTDANYFKAIALARLGRAQEAREMIDLDRFVEISELPAPGGFRDAAAFRAGLAEEIVRNPTLMPDLKTTRDGLQTRRLRQPGAVHVDALLEQIKAAIDDYETRLSDDCRAFASTRPKAAWLAPWAVVYGAAGRQKAHRHPKGWLSGVFYVTAPRRDSGHCGPLVLGMLGPEFAVGEPPWGTRKIEPVPGRLVMFPSYVPHGTEQTDIEEARISVAFDVIPI
jgi:tetratricopeptide (TPR) repeat protein